MAKLLNARGGDYELWVSEGGGGGGERWREREKSLQCPKLLCTNGASADTPHGKSFLKDRVYKVRAASVCVLSAFLLGVVPRNAFHQRERPRGDF